MRAPASIAAGIALLIGLVAVPASAQLPIQTPDLPVETPQLPETPDLPVGELPELPVELPDLGGFEEVLQCLTGGSLVPDPSNLNLDAVVGVIQCIYETTAALLQKSLGEALSGVGADVPLP